MATPVTMPQLGETVVEGTIVKWLKSEGDSIERDEPLFEISTDKVDTEVPSPVAGVLKEIKVQEGETVEVGTELAVVDEGGDGQAAGPAAEQETPEPPQPGQEPEGPAPTAQPQEEPSQPGAREGDGEAAPREAAAAEPVTQSATEPRAKVERGPRSHILSPLVRRLAEENNIDLDQVQGTGTGGRITKKDIMAFIESGGAARPAAGAAAQPALQPVPEPQPAAAA
ncbi:MAG TPA: biotin/lipoyl-containing protein, partial [Actinomycetota bacterium]|nr:biotin/lipoyl-containing protein [Actinomycetota bacterium]